KEGRCDFCGACVAVCPEDAIELRESSIKIDGVKCTDCLLCVYVCPFEVLMGVRDEV
ncbi:MAG: 4Fe-4S binding protein, partial [Fidelibacterota bacterium]